MKYAVIQASGAQYKVSEGDELDLFHMEGKQEGNPVEFEKVLLISSDDGTIVGQPLISNAMVRGKVIKLLRGEKIRVATYKAKSRHRKVMGHRDELTRVKIERIMLDKKQKTESRKQRTENTKN